MKNLLLPLSFMILPAGGVTLTEVDDFNSSVEGWFEGGSSNTQPIQIPVGGPDGSGFLQDVSNGFPPGKNMQFWNVTQWTGDFLGIGLDRITMDAINFNGVGGDSLHLRLAFNGAGGWFVTDPFELLAETGWQSLDFDLSIDSLIYAGAGTGAYDATMSDVTRMQIISLAPESPFVIGLNSGVQGDAIPASLGIDNIRAGQNIPEPASTLLILLSAGALLRRRR